jgi:hypothetical protein
LASVPGGAKEELQYSTSADYSVTVTQGAQTEVKMITGEISKCPKTVFVLLGYSKGVSEVISCAAHLLKFMILTFFIIENNFLSLGYGPDPDLEQQGYPPRQNRGCCSVWEPVLQSWGPSK